MYPIAQVRHGSYVVRCEAGKDIEVTLPNLLLGSCLIAGVVDDISYTLEKLFYLPLGETNALLRSRFYLHQRDNYRDAITRNTRIHPLPHWWRNKEALELGLRGRR